jgi:hypothetical protein
MRTSITTAVLLAHPDIEDILWSTMVHAMDADWAIRASGLHVRVRKAPEDRMWWGWAYPEEHSTFYRKRLVHPAGRITLTIGNDVSKRDIVRLVAHELRHIGQFHRGRKLTGFLTAGWMDDDEVEPDCYAFEEHVIKQYGRV